MTVNARIFDTETTTGSHTITDGRISATNGSPFTKFAKACIAVGYDPERDLIVRRHGTQVFEAKSLAWWAKRGVKKSDG